MNQLLHILQIEDSDSDAALVRRILEKAGYQVFSERVDNAAAMRAALARRDWDLVLADYRLPQFDATAALVILHQGGQDVPFIVVSGAIGEELAVIMMKSGAHDYLMKDNLVRLVPAVERELREARTRRERREAERELATSQERLREQSDTLDRQNTSLKEKEALLREIHHRVKNNMQVVSSLLGLQSRATTSPEAAKILLESQHRIHAMALLHKTLYQSGNLAAVDLPSYIRQIVDHLFISYGMSDRQIRLSTQLEPVRLSLDTALPCGLIINEVVSNSLKHAFPNGRAGEVSIELREEPVGTACLVLADDGVGMNPDLDWTTSRTLGLRLVRALTEQLSAKLDIHYDRGTRVVLTFAAAVDTPQPELLAV